MSTFWWLPLAFLFLSILACAGAEQAAGPEPATLETLAPGFHFQKAALPSGKTLNYAISVPADYDPADPVPLVIALHYGGEVTPYYGGEMIDFLFEPALRDLGAIVVAPDALGGGNWTTGQNEDAVVWLTRAIMNSYAVDPNKVLLTGYSMGGQGTWHIGGRNQDLFTAAMPISGEAAREEVEWTIPVLVMHSLDDEVLPFRQAEDLYIELKRQGANAELKVVTGVTHYETQRFAAPLRESVQWLRSVWAGE
jgi:predicted peptidase